LIDNDECKNMFYNFSNYKDKNNCCFVAKKNEINLKKPECIEVESIKIE